VVNPIHEPIFLIAPKFHPYSYLHMCDHFHLCSMFHYGHPNGHMFSMSLMSNVLPIFHPYGQAISISFRIIHVVYFINVVPHTCKIVTRIEGHGMEHTLSHDRHIHAMLYTNKLDIFLNCSHFEGVRALQAIKVC